MTVRGEDHLEVLVRAYEAFNGHDPDALLEVCHPEIEFRSAFAAVEGSYDGHEGARRYMADIEAAFGPEWRALAESMEPLPDGRVFVVATVKGHGVGSGVPLEQRLAHIWSLEDGMLRSGTVYLDVVEAREAARLPAP